MKFTLRSRKIAGACAAAAALLSGVGSCARADDGASNPNLALHKQYQVSDPNKYSFGIGGLTDGSWVADQTHCFATGDTDSFPKTATIDLITSAKIGAVVLGVPAVGSTKTITVSVSADGKAFTDVGTYVFTQGKEERHTYAFAAVDARYVRLTYPDHYDKVVNFPATFSFTEECEVYANSPATHAAM